MSSRFSGQALLELLVASGMFLIVSTSVITIVMSGRSLGIDSHDSSRATDIAQEGLEAARLIRDEAWDSLTIGIHGLAKSGNDWQFNGSSDISNQFTRTVTVSSISANSKLVESRVSWPALPTRTPFVVLSSILTNWEVTQQQNFIGGDWKNPVTAGTADVDSGAQATDVLVDNGIVYLSSSSSQQEKADLSVFNVADPYNPIRLSSVDLGVSNIAAIAKSDQYVYGSISGASDEIMIVDVSNPSAPIKVKSLDISLGKSISTATDGNRLYVGMERLSGQGEFYVLDITDRVNPIVLGTFEINGDVRGITIFNSRAYLATSVDSEEFIILDVANPAVITKLGAYDLPSTEDVSSVFVKDEFNVYLGRDQSSSAHEFFYLNAGAPAAISLKGSYNLNSGVNDLLAVNNLVFMVTEQSNAEFRILDVTDPSNITSYSYLNFPQVATGIDFENNTVYVSVRSNSALRIIKSGP